MTSRIKELEGGKPKALRGQYIASQADDNVVEDERAKEFGPSSDPVGSFVSDFVIKN
jgi:hypothetical protein